MVLNGDVDGGGNNDRKLDCGGECNGSKYCWWWCKVIRTLIVMILAM